jgi:riboflavin kinase/FMN adenylyltransferase
MSLPCVVTDEVVHGLHLGSAVGMPTANLGVDGRTLGIEPGVYASRITVRGEPYIGVTSVGTRPTVDDDPAIKIETHILDFDDDIYGETVTLEILSFLRGIVKFPSLEAVKREVDKDCAKARTLITL